jgi:hypothetical protein
MLRLSDDDDEGYQYKSKPNNPNILVGVKTDNNKKITTTKIITEEPSDPKKPKITTEETKVIEEVLPKKTQKTTTKEVEEIEEFLAPKLQKSLSPLYSLINMMSTESGKIMYYRYDESISQEKRKIPIVWGCKSRKEFYEKNEHLGENIIFALKALFPEKVKTTTVNPKQQQQTVLTPKKTTSIPSQIIQPAQQQQQKKQDTDSENDSDDDLSNAFANIGVPIYTPEQKIHFDRLFANKELSIDNAPSWLWYHIDNSAFQFMLQTMVYGALELAADEIGYPLQDLIYSKDIRPKFAQYVARKFVSPKQNAKTDTVNQGQVQYRIHSGFYMNQQDTKWLMGAKLFFENEIYYKSKPATQQEFDDVNKNITNSKIQVNNIFTVARNELNRADATENELLVILEASYPGSYKKLIIYQKELAFWEAKLVYLQNRRVLVKKENKRN